MRAYAGDTSTGGPLSTDPAGDGRAFRHEALLYEDLGNFVDGTVGFIEDGISEKAATLVVVNAAKISALRAALGTKANGVRFADMSEVGANPARIIPAWHDFVDQHAGSGRPLRGIGEPIWAERTSAELAECHIHEALLNLAFAESGPFWLLCPYDVRALDGAALDGAHRNHPFIHESTRCSVSPDFSVMPAELFGEPLPSGPADASSRDFEKHGLVEIRSFIAERAAAFGLDRARTADLQIAVNELATNSVVHGAGTGTLAVWQQDGAMVCEVSDGGSFDAPLIGRRRPTLTQPNGRGFWMVNQLCDLVQLRNVPSGTVVRVHQYLP
jgi:anti-sigma regulatory factor (Ser/Thr protein kinase)